MKDMALILQGGGALGAFEYGAVTRLVELGWTPKAVTGVSIGAINAAAIAGAKGGDVVAGLDRVWDAITMPEAPLLPPSQQGFLSMFGNPHFYTPRTDYLAMAGWTSLYQTAPMCATLARLCDFGQINDASHMRIGVTATDLSTGALTTFSNHVAQDRPPSSAADGRRHVSRRASLDARHVMASGSLPPGFPAIDIDGVQYWDGGLFSNTPIDALLDMLDAEQVATLPIFVLDLFPSAGLPAPANLPEVQSRSTMLQYQNRFWAQYGGSGDIGGFTAMLDAVDAALKDNPALQESADYRWLMRMRALKNLRVVQAPVPLMTGASDFSRYGIAAARRHGREAIDAYFAADRQRQADGALPQSLRVVN